MDRCVTIGERTVVVVGAGYEGKRRCYERLAAIGARLVIVDEPGHWSESLVDELAGTKWVAAPLTGDPDIDAGAILDALERSGVRPDGVLTFWESSVCEAARVAAALGLPGKDPAATENRRDAVEGLTRDLLHPPDVQAPGAGVGGELIQAALGAPGQVAAARAV